MKLYYTFLIVACCHILKYFDVYAYFTVILGKLNLFHEMLKNVFKLSLTFIDDFNFDHVFLQG